MAEMTFQQAIDHLLAEIQDLRRQLGGAEIAIAMLGKPLASSDPETAGIGAGVLKNLPEGQRNLPCVLALLTGLEGRNRSAQTPAQSRPTLRIVDTPDPEA